MLVNQLIYLASSLFDTYVYLSVLTTVKCKITVFKVIQNNLS